MADDIDVLQSVLSKTTGLLQGAAGAPPGTPTPSPAMDLQALRDHMVTQVTAFATSAEGGTPDGTSKPDGEAGEAFGAAARRAVAAFRDGAIDRTLTLGSPLPGSTVLAMMIMEYIGHGWDLAKATGQPVPYTDAEAAVGLATGRAMLTPEYRGPETFGAEVEVPAGAPVLDQLLGFMGRDPSA